MGSKIENLKSKIKNFYYWHYLILTILAVIFFIGASSFNYFSQAGGFIKWLSPDETANYTFAKLYAETGDLKIFEKYNSYVKDIIHPRSFRSDFGVLKPVSFLGVTLIYGKIAALTGYAALADYKTLPYLTPFFAAVGILFYYLLIKKIFGRTNAFISAFLLASFPAYIYYSARSMFHNVLFVVLLIVGLYFSVMMARDEKGAAIFTNQPSPWRGRQIISQIHKWLFAALAGFFIGLSLITRTSEFLWIAPMLVILWIFNFRKVGIIKLIIFISFLFLAFLPVFYWNKVLYGSFWTGGYPEMNQSIINISSAGSELAQAAAVGNFSHIRELLGKIKNYIFHFGFYPLQSAKMFYFYFVRMFYWIFWPAAFGFLFFLFRPNHWRKKHLAYLLSYFIVSLILLFYYGSWGFHDNPDPKSHTIGNSYARYWLPLYLGAFPFASLFIARLTELLKKKYFVLAARILAMALIFYISVPFVMFGSEEGLVNSYRRQAVARVEYEKVLRLTEANAVIITLYHDKLLFPERKVVVGLFDDDNMIAEYAKLADHLPVYYYNFTLPKKDFEYLNGPKLLQFGLQMEEVEKISKDFSLYRLKRTDKIIPLIAYFSLLAKERSY